jgi:hypothetical protein
LEFGAVLDDLGEMKTIEQLPRFQCYFVQEKYTGSPYALSMHPKIFKEIANFKSDGIYAKSGNFLKASKFGILFAKFLVNNGYKEENGKITITAAGKNFGAFDLQFLKKQTNLLDFVNIRHRILDPSILFLEKEDVTLPSTDICKMRAKVDGEIKHDAISDAIDVIKLIRCKLGKIYSS